MCVLHGRCTDRRRASRLPANEDRLKTGRRYLLLASSYDLCAREKIFSLKRNFRRLTRGNDAWTTNTKKNERNSAREERERERREILKTPRCNRSVAKWSFWRASKCLRLDSSPTQCPIAPAFSDFHGQVPLSARVITPILLVRPGSDRDGGIERSLTFCLPILNFTARRKDSALHFLPPEIGSKFATVKLTTQMTKHAGHLYSSFMVHVFNIKIC